MTLFEIVKKLKEIALKMPNINSVYDGDVYMLNSIPNIDYNVFFITQSQHTVNEDTTQFNLTLYFIDRVFNDYSNALSIQSTGIEVLSSIIKKFEYDVDEVNVDYGISFNTFTHKFSDVCAGVYCNLTIEVNNNINICGE